VKPRLPEIDALIDRALRVRVWLQEATSCGCERIDDCRLFDDPELPSAKQAPLVAITRVNAS
jgi:hypothetical protein